MLYRSLRFFKSVADAVESRQPDESGFYRMLGPRSAKLPTPTAEQTARRLYSAYWQHRLVVERTELPGWDKLPDHKRDRFRAMADDVHRVTTLLVEQEGR